MTGRALHHARILAATPWLGASTLLAAGYVACREIGQLVAGAVPP